MQVASLPAVARFRDNNARYEAPASSAPAGSTTMTRILVCRLLRRNLLGSTGINHIWTNTTNPGANGGWRLQYRITVLSLRGQVGDGGGVTRTVSFPVTSELFQDYLLVIMTYNETELVLRIRGAEVSAGPFVGFTAPTQNTTVGANPGGASSGENTAVACMLGSDTVALDAAGRAAAEASIQDDLEQGRDIATAAGFDEFYWDARDVVTGPGVGKTPWSDRIANIVLTRIGRPEGFGFPARFD